MHSGPTIARSLARRIRRPAIATLTTALLVIATPAHANLFPDWYLFSDRPEPVSLALGSVLFHFYQEDHRATLAEAAYVEQRFARAGQPLPGRNQLLLAKGSAALGLGMLISARAWLDEVNADALPPTALPRLHLALARVAFLDGDDLRARELLARLPPDYGQRPDVAYLRCELARRAGDLPAMASALEGIAEDDPLWFFGWHNYAVAARAQNDATAAAAAFDRLAATRPETPSALDIAVRAGLQGAMLRFETGDLRGAIERLDRVPVAGSYGRTALAQRAQLALAGQDWRTAAKLFTALAAPADDRWDSERVDALIGISFVQEQTRGGRAALPAYARAAEGLEARVRALTQLQSSLGDSAWLRALIELERSARAGALADLVRARFAEEDDDDAEDAAAADATRLQTQQHAQWQALAARFNGVDWLAWLAADGTQRELLGWRRLGDASARLRLLADSSMALLQAAQEQELRLARAAERMRGTSVVARMDRLQDELQAQSERLARYSDAASWQTPAGADAALHALASADERSQLELLARAADAAQSRADPNLQRRIARMQGVLRYRIESERAERIWTQEKARRAAERRLAQIDLRGTRIAQAENEREHQSGAEQQVLQLRTRLQALADTAERLKQAREAQLTAGLRARIAADRADSEAQLAYAHLAMARISDASLTVQQGRSR